MSAVVHLKEGVTGCHSLYTWVIGVSMISAPIQIQCQIAIDKKKENESERLGAARNAHHSVAYLRAHLSTTEVYRACDMSFSAFDRYANTMIVLVTTHCL